MRQLMKGNDAIAEAAVRAGMRFFSGYPITPQTEILEYLSKRLPEVGGTFVQTESEISGISMVYGAAATGFRTMPSSSGPGFSLLQEGISYIASAELPCVIVDVMRYGTGLGDIFQAQGDYLQVVKNGGHGDYRCLVYAPSSVQEAADLMTLAFDKAEAHRNPVILLSDASISQMMEPVELPEMREHDPDQYQWSLKGRRSPEDFRRVTSNMYYIDDYDRYIQEKYQRIEEQEQRWQAVETEDAEFVLVAYGISSRICKEAVRLGRSQGIKLGLIRPITLYPYPVKAFEACRNAKCFISCELTPLAQMAEDVALAEGMQKDVYAITGGMEVFDSKDILDEVARIAAGEKKAVYKGND